MKTKKLLLIPLIVLCLIIVPILAACGEKNNNNGDNGGETQTIQCSVCKKAELQCECPYTEGLSFTSISGGTAFALSGIGTATGTVIIPSVHNGLPVTEIQRGAFGFGRGKNLTRIVIPNSVTTAIPDFAFEDCTNLVSITIGNGVTSIGQEAFIKCVKLERIYFGSSITSLGIGVFSGATSLKSIAIPDNLIYVSGWSLYGSALTDIKVSEGNPNLKAIDGVLFSKDGTKLLYYLNGKTEKNYIIPSSVTSIEFGALNQTNLESLVIPSTITMNRQGINPKLTLYMERATTPDEWDSGWNYGNCPIIWGVTLSSDKSYVMSFTKTENSISHLEGSRWDSVALEYVPFIKDLSAPFRQGFTFGGWATTQGGTTAAYTAANVHTAPNGTMLYAIWRN